MSIAVKTDTGWQVLGVGESSGSGGGATKWGDWTIVDAPDEQNTWSAPDSQGRIWKYVEFNKAGDYTINLTGGMYWVLCVGGGGSGFSTSSTGYRQGQPGLISEGYWEFQSGPQNITVGSKGSGSGWDSGSGKPSSVGNFGQQGYVSWGDYNTGRGGVTDGDPAGYKSLITNDPNRMFATGRNGNPDVPGKAGGQPGQTGDGQQTDGCVIIATVDEDKTDYYPPGAVPGLGGWATITGIDGTAGTRYQYGDWVAYEFKADGELTTSGGLVESLLVGHGAPDNTLSLWGGAGQVHSSVHSVPTQTKIFVPDVPVRNGPPIGTGIWSGDKTVDNAIIGVNGGGNGGSTAAGGSAQWQTDDDNFYKTEGSPTTSSIRQGFPETYARASGSTGGYTPGRSSTGYGDGGTSQAGKGFKGVVICRVPKAHAYLGALPAGWVDA
jgi:hypothetical protein